MCVISRHSGLQRTSKHYNPKTHPYLVFMPSPYSMFHNLKNLYFPSFFYAIMCFQCSYIKTHTHSDSDLWPDYLQLQTRRHCVIPSTKNCGNNFKEIGWPHRVISRKWFMPHRSDTSIFQEATCTLSRHCQLNTQREKLTRWTNTLPNENAANSLCAAQQKQERATGCAAI